MEDQPKEENNSKVDNQIKIKIDKLKFFQISTVALALILVILIGLNFSSSGNANQIGEKVVKYVNENLLSSGFTAKLISVDKKGDMYLVNMNITGEYNGQKASLPVSVYVNKEGTLMFNSQTAIDMTAPLPRPTSNEASQTENIQKSEKPKVELFVMSYCPYGMQIEKGILPVIKTLGDKIDFSIKFCNYIMHGEKEMTENLLQTCIQKEYPSKYFDYLECFLSEGKTDECMNKTQLNQSKLNICVKDLDERYNVTKLFNDKTTWLGGNFPRFLVFEEENQKYGVAGSPTLVINGVSVSSGRSPSALLNIICSAFTETPKECNTSLSTETPSPGLGYNAGSETTATCG